MTDQSGIYAGKGGYDIKVGNNTDLKGAVIASEAEDSDKNRLDTGTISFSDIKNKADYKVSSSSMGVGTSGMPTPPSSYNKNGKASSTTHSAVSNGTLIVRNEDEQKQDINTLSRDTEHASKELKHIFNKDKEQSIIDQTQLISEIGGQTLTMLNNIDKITATAEANKALDKERQKAQAEDTVLTEKEQQEIYKEAYDKAMNNGMSAMGSDTRQGVEMATSIIKGLITGDMTGATAGALAPKLASEIKKYTEHKNQLTGENKIDYVSNTVAHAILGAVVAELQGNSALAGGLGAAYGERSAEIIAKILYPDKAIDKLSQEEKQQVSALAQLAAGLTTAALGGDAQDINTAMAGGKNAFENNGGSFENANGMAPLIDWHDSYGQAYDSAIKAPNLTEEEIFDTFKNISSQKGAYNPASDYVELWMRAPEQIGAFLPRPISTAMAALALADSYLTETDKANLVAVLHKAGSDYSSGESTDSLLQLDNLLNRLGLGSTNKHLQSIIKNKVESNVAKTQKGNESSKFGEHAKNEKELNNKPLDKDYFESEYEKGNVQQGGGNYKETKDNIYDNQVTNQKGNQSSNFEQHTNNESKLAENWNNTNQAHNAANASKHNAELVGKEISNGHAYDKHVIKQEEFKDLGIKTKKQFAEHIENVVSNYTSFKELSGGRTAYWHEQTGTVVIRNPKAKDGGTAFRPVDKRKYFDDLK